MILISRFKILMAELKVWVNATAGTENYTDVTIGDIVYTVNETHAVKRLKDKPGVILLIQYPSADTQRVNRDNYSEANHMLLFIIQKKDPSGQTNAEEEAHYDTLQYLTRKAKEFLNERSAGGSMCGNEEMLDKAFRTEPEYQVFGGWNGYSISFDIKDFNL